MLNTRTKINHLCCYVMLIWAFLPLLGAYQSSILFQVPFLGALAIWIVTGYSQMKTDNRKLCIRLMIPYLVIMYFYVLIGYGNLNVPTSFNYILLLGFVINSINYIENTDYQFDRRTFHISLLLLITTAITTLMVLLVDGSASRTLTSSSSDDSIKLLYKQLNVGSFDFIYGLVVILPMLFFYFLNLRKRIFKIAVFGIAALFIAVIVMSNFTTALLLLFMDLIIVLLVGMKIKSSVTFGLFFVLILVLVPLLLTSFINLMMDFADSIYAQNKLEGIVGIINGQESYEDTTPRSELLRLSIVSFFDSPLWGVGAWYGGNTGFIGQHSQFVDDLARYGLIGFVPLFFFVYYGLKNIFKEYKEIHFYNRKVLASLLVYFILGFLNPIYNPALLASIFIVVPVLDRLLCREKYYI